jgi:hypothetical protein
MEYIGKREKNKKEIHNGILSGNEQRRTPKGKGKSVKGL